MNLQLACLVQLLAALGFVLHYPKVQVDLVVTNYLLIIVASMQTMLFVQLFLLLLITRAVNSIEVYFSRCLPVLARRLKKIIDNSQSEFWGVEREKYHLEVCL